MIKKRVVINAGPYKGQVGTVLLKAGKIDYGTKDTKPCYIVQLETNRMVHISEGDVSVYTK